MAFIDDYFARIGFSGVARADYATLKQLHLLHTCHIPFENLDVLLERPILLDDAHLSDKLLSARRGGYCYEQNGVFTRALRELGFAVQDLGARVVLANPPEMPPRTHRLSLITLDDTRWLADVGFGGQTLSTPIEFIPTPCKPRRTAATGLSGMKMITLWRRATTRAGRRCTASTWRTSIRRII